MDEKEDQNNSNTMKTTFTLLLLWLNLYMVHAQFTISADSIYVDVEAGEDYGTVDIQNDSIGGNILWVLRTECEPENWTHYVMDMNISYIPGVDSLGFALEANGTGFLSVFLLLSEPPGEAHYVLEIWEEGDREHNKFVRFFFNGTDCQLTSHGDRFTQRTVKVFPNPFSETLYLETQEGSLIQVFDMFGRQVHRQRLDPLKNSEIFLSELSSGTYFITLSSQDDQVLGRFLVIKN
jgi:hypothetical protein